MVSKFQKDFLKLSFVPKMNKNIFVFLPLLSDFIYLSQNI